MQSSANDSASLFVMGAPVLSKWLMGIFHSMGRGAPTQATRFSRTYQHGIEIPMRYASKKLLMSASMVKLVVGTSSVAMRGAHLLWCRARSQVGVWRQSHRSSVWRTTQIVHHNSLEAMP